MNETLGARGFAKYEALGNDYLVVDGETFGVPLTTAFIERLCHRHYGVGSDGVLVRGAGPAPDLVGLRIFNPDGSEAEKSGNGLRIFARFLYDFGYVRASRMRIHTPGGEVEAALALRGDEVEAITVSMGRARFGSDAVPMAGLAREVQEEHLDVAGEEVRVNAVSMGNPHCVVFVPALDAATLRRLGPRLERHPRFPNRTNVQLVRVTARDRLDILIWERGAGETLASGSSSCAAAAVAYKRGLVDGKLQVHMPGGVLGIGLTPDFDVTMTGPATPVARGEVLLSG
ncbi:MAG TPA: diaminopimelate epimerase [Myxococcota bacterium]|nr:diaminopimelate epimerase [Myxococcota bacterium]